MKILFLILLFLGDWSETPTVDTNYKLFYSNELKTSKWIGCADPNYSWDGERLSYERMVKDENGKDILVRTYKDAIEIIANFQPETKVFGIAGKIEENAVKKFGGALKGFIWVDDVSGGGEVILPFTSPHIFIATGSRLDPTLTEIGTDPNENNYYEIVDGNTHIFVESFSGVGGAAGIPSTLTAHYKMNENTASDNDELVTNGNFANWTADNPDGWTVTGESGNDPEVSEVGTGEGHGGVGTGMCNIYTSDGTLILIEQDVTVVIGRRYKLLIIVDTVTAGTAKVQEMDSTQFTQINLTAAQTYTTTFVATSSTVTLRISRRTIGLTDVTFDKVSLKLCAAEDSSGNDHDGILQEDTSDASVTGKILTAFDFDGSADYIEIGDHADFTPALTPFSASIWLNPHGTTSLPIVNKGVYNTDGEWRFYLSAADKIIANFFDESVANCYIGRKYNTALTSYQNTWIHLVMTYDGGTASSGVKIYLNGVRIDDTDDENGTFVAVEDLTHAVWIGYDGTNYADGLIDNVMFFSTELDQAEVNFLYNFGLGREEWTNYSTLFMGTNF